MNKIDKLDKELEKAREKAAEWQAKIRELEKQKQEEENSQIVQAVRSLKLTPAQLMAFLNDPKNSLTASGHSACFFSLCLPAGRSIFRRGSRPTGHYGRSNRIL